MENSIELLSCRILQKLISDLKNHNVAITVANNCFYGMYEEPPYSLQLHILGKSTFLFRTVFFLMSSIVT